MRTWAYLLEVSYCLKLLMRSQICRLLTSNNLSPVTQTIHADKTHIPDIPAVVEPV